MILTLKKALLFCAVAVVLGAISVYGMSMIAPREALKAVTVEGINEELGLKLTMTLDKTTFQLGEPVNISLTMTNVSNRTVKLNIMHLGHRFDFRIYNITHEDIYQWNRGHGCAMVDEVILEPDESLSRNLQWEQICNNYRIVPRDQLVVPGTYYIVGQTGPVSYVNGERLLDVAIAESAELEITIT